MLWVQDYFRISIILPLLCTFDLLRIGNGSDDDWGLFQDGFQQIDDAESALDDFMNPGHKPAKPPAVQPPPPPPTFLPVKPVIVYKQSPPPSPPPTTTTTTTTTPPPPPPTTTTTRKPPRPTRKKPTHQYSPYSYYPNLFPNNFSEEDTFAGSMRGCSLSDSEVNGKSVCKGDVIFFEDFNGGTTINRTKWSHEIMMPGAPDFGFVYYRTNSVNSFIKGGKLFIKPTLSDDLFVVKGQLDLNGCTAPRIDQCRGTAQNFRILPPVASARLTTKNSVSFKYGKVEVRAKLPVGDWVVPEIWLEPKENSYGTSPLRSGRIVIAMARGNENLWWDSEDYGNKRLEMGVHTASKTKDKFRRARDIRKPNVGWGNDYHNFTLKWTPRNLEFFVDGESQGALCESHHPLYELMKFNRDEAGEWTDGSLIAPFDKEFYISLGVSVGGHHNFPDGSVNIRKKKPWTNFNVKAMSDFWNARNDWYPSWTLEGPALKVNYVKITAI